MYKPNNSNVITIRMIHVNTIQQLDMICKLFFFVISTI